MNRIEVNDLLMTSYFGALRQTGYTDVADNLEKGYEVQRAEIIANEERVNDAV